MIHIDIKDKNLVVAPVQVEPHTGGQQLVLLILKKEIGGCDGDHRDTYQVHDLLQGHSKRDHNGRGFIDDWPVLGVVVL